MVQILIFFILLASLLVRLSIIRVMLLFVNHSNVYFFQYAGYPVQGENLCFYTLATLFVRISGVLLPDCNTTTGYQASHYANSPDIRSKIIKGSNS